MSKWHLFQNQPSLREIYKEPPIVSYKKGKSLGDILVRAKLQGQGNTLARAHEPGLACQHFISDSPSDMPAIMRTIAPAKHLSSGNKHEMKTRWRIAANRSKQTTKG